MSYQLVIFDMDGTLVQSEDCASQALIDVIPALRASVSELTARYRGMRLLDIFNDIESRHPGAIPDQCLDIYRAREELLSATMIQASPGADDMLSRLGKPKCIASNAPTEKTWQSLHNCGLSGHFTHGIFSANDLQALVDLTMVSPTLLGSIGRTQLGEVVCNGNTFFLGELLGHREYQLIGIVGATALFPGAQLLLDITRMLSRQSWGTGRHIAHAGRAMTDRVRGPKDSQQVHKTDPVPNSLRD